MIKSLKQRGADLADTREQLKFLNNGLFQSGEYENFQSHLASHGHAPLKPSKLDIFQVNLGYMCNQRCKHCHVDAGPDRKEIMDRETMQLCIDHLAASGAKTLDLTGGAPEMNPNFTWMVEQAKSVGVEEIIVRSNLTILVANKKYRELPEFFARHGLRVVSSLPYFSESKTDRQRGEGVFSKSIEALKLLNEVGYGQENSGLLLDLVYNPSGAFLPGDQAGLETQFKTVLDQEYDIQFNHLLTITNLPISRFLDYLRASGNYEEYMDKLITAFNPAAVEGLMCRNTLSVDYLGYLYDCDFNQMLNLKVAAPGSQHLKEVDFEALSERSIVVNQHCFGCTAGAGSSCQGSLV